MKNYGYIFFFGIAASTWAVDSPATSDSKSATELAKKLANPVASLISVPIQYNDDELGGSNSGAAVSRLFIQPVIPFSLTEDWNLITRTIIQGVEQYGFKSDILNESGTGDSTASQFFSPKEPTDGGLIWGVGPVELLPTASESVLGTEKWGLGPTGVVLKQSGPWTAGLLASQIWSVAGDSDRDDLNVLSLQPFFSYTTETHTTIGMYTESTYDWHASQWSVPVIVQAGQIFKIGSQIMQFAIAGKYWAESPENGYEGWGIRGQLTLLFPKQ